MTFKRARICPRSRLVNANGAALALLAAACSGGSEEPAPAPPTETARALELPVVWGTRDLPGQPIDLALGGGGEPALAVVYEDGGLQFFNLNAERLSEPAQFDIVRIATGQPAVIGGASITIFPGLSRDGAPKAYIFSRGLDAPAELPLPIDLENGVEALGLCAGGLAFRNDGLFNLAYWTDAAPRTLVRGVVGVDEETLTWTETERLDYDSDIGACLEAEAGVVVAAGGAARWRPHFGAGAAREAVTADRFALLDGRADGLLIAIGDDGASVAPIGDPFETVAFKDGLSVAAPAAPTAVAALSEVRFGGYPDGLIVVAGPAEDGRAQAVFIDAGPLASLRD